MQRDKLHDVPPEITAAAQLAIGTLVLLPFMQLPVAGYDVTTWGYLLTLGIVHTGLLYVLLYGAIQKLETSSVAVLSFLYPATALGFDVLIYGVRPGVMQIGGMVAILLAVLGERLEWSIFRNLPATAGK